MFITNHSQLQNGPSVRVMNADWERNPQKCSYSDCIRTGLKIGQITTNNAEALEKATKNSQRMIELALLLGLTTSTPLANLSNTLKGSADLFDLIPSIRILHLLFSPQENGQYFLFDQAHTAIEKIAQVFLANHLVCKAIRVLNKWNLIELGRFSRGQIGNFPLLFSLFTDSLISISSLFTIANSYYCLGILEGTAHKVEIKGVARLSRTGPVRDALVTLPRTIGKVQQAKIEKKVTLSQERKVQWMRIADAVGTIAVVTLSMLLAIYQVTTLASTAVFLLFAFVGDSIGFVKIFVEQNVL